jgi:hypothetical protein
VGIDSDNRRRHEQERKGVDYIDGIEQQAQRESKRHNGHEREPGEDEFEGIRTARELLGQPTTPAAYCVPDRIHSGLILLGGRPKAKKSWMALQVCIARATGGETLGKRVARRRVLGLFLEDNDPRMRRRLQFFGLTNETAPELLHIEYDWPVGDLGVGKLERWMQTYPDTGLIVIDVLQRFRGPKDPRRSIYEADYASMTMLHGLCAKYPGLTVLVLHHIRKGAVEEPDEALNGSYGIAGCADGYIILCRRLENERWALHIDGRDWESFEHDHVVEWRADIGWAWLGVLDERLATTDNQAEILTLAKKDGFVTPTVVAGLFNISRPTAHGALQLLVKKDLLYNDGRGRYRPVQVTMP